MSELDARDAESSRDETSKAVTIYDYSYYSAQALWEAFEQAKAVRGASRGGTTDNEQDILRAMLVMAASGLDSALKQLIRDCIPRLIQINPAIHAKFEKFTLGELQRGSGSSGSESRSNKFLASVLAAPHPQTALVEAYVYDLTGSSLQSADQVMMVAGAFCLDTRKLRKELESLKTTFRIRNRIIHELDIDLEGKTRKRNRRSHPDMKRRTEHILSVCIDVVDGVGEKFDT